MYHSRWEVVTKGYDIGFGLYHKPLGHTAKLHAGEMIAKVRSVEQHTIFVDNIDHNLQ